MKPEHSTFNYRAEKSRSDGGGGAAVRYDLNERLLEFGARVIRVTFEFQDNAAGRHVALQLIRSATSPLANHAEAQGAKSHRDFINKLRTCLQEMREANRWLELARRVPLLSDPGLISHLISESEELIRIFYSSIRTAESNTGTRLHEDPFTADFDNEVEAMEVQCSGLKVESSR